MKRRSSGFSLIELMVVVAIATLLAVIAIPSYNNQVRKSRRTEAKTAIMDLAAREERYFATQNVYSSDGVALQYGVAFPVATANYYSISVPNMTQPTANPAAPGTYTLWVVPAAGSSQLKDTSCQKFIVDQTGKQTSQDVNGNDSTTTCWP
jgi:type IV pilus assembly protein PilE